MAILRFKALEEAFSHKPMKVEIPEGKTSDYYGMRVFDKGKMQKYLSKDAYEAVVGVLDFGQRIDRKVADQVATGMKAWAMEHGVTHYTHWFHPLTEGTAEKHDAFVEHSGSGGEFGGG